MRNHIRFTCSALAVAGAFIAGPALANDTSTAQEMDPQMAEMMKKMETAGTPGAPHKALEPLVGTWTVEVKTWMAPDAPPTVTKGTAEVNWIMGDRFVQEEFNGEFMGKPFRGMSLTGYDNTKQRYNNVWIDDMHTAIFVSEGQAKDGGKVITLEGQYDCPITGEEDKAMKQVLRIISADKHVLEMYDPSQGENVKTMEITYTRK